MTAPALSRRPRVEVEFDLRRAGRICRRDQVETSADERRPKAEAAQLSAPCAGVLPPRMTV